MLSEFPPSSRARLSAARETERARNVEILEEFQRARLAERKGAFVASMRFFSACSTAHHRLRWQAVHSVFGFSALCYELVSTGVVCAAAWKGQCSGEGECLLERNAE